MTEFLYFAYGSNILRERLRASNRCPSAEFVGLAIARGWSLSFHKKSKDGSGKAMLTRCDDAQSYGVLYKIKGDNERAQLDEAEGTGYIRHDNFAVECAESKEERICSVYMIKENPIKILDNSTVDKVMIPFCWYKALVICGARQNKIPDEYISAIRDVEHQKCANPPSKELKILKDAGFDNWRELI